MDEADIRRLAARSVIRQLAENKQYYVPAGISNRHIHLSQAVLEQLFGREYALHPERPLSQPGQFACAEKLTLAGGRGRMDGVRVLGPVRAETQVEITLTDSFALGIPPMVRMSGELDGTPGARLIGPAGEVTLRRGVIVAARHLHLSEEEAGWFGLQSGDVVSVAKRGERAAVLGNVRVRAGRAHAMELHMDTDEANAAGIGSGDFLELLI